MTGYNRDYTWEEATFPWNSPTAQQLAWNAASRSGSGVLSDIKLRGAALGQAAFEAEAKSGGPVGFRPFQTFIDGDYVYDKAMIRMVMTSSVADRPVISGLRAIVDVPDVFERGSKTLSGSERIYFTKTFLVPPDVIPAFRTGPMGTQVEVTSVTSTYFDVTTTLAGEPVVATITWVAIGY